MIKLSKATIEKYKCIESAQSFEVESDVTVLVGMNESGKTAVLEALAKTNYFNDDPKFKFDLTHDFPRKETKRIKKDAKAPTAIHLEFEVSDQLIDKINADIGAEVFAMKTIKLETNYGNTQLWNNIEIDLSKFVDKETKSLGISSAALNEKIREIRTLSDLEALKAEYSDEKKLAGIAALSKYYKNEWNWTHNPIGEYIARTYLKPNLPKYLYYDEFYSLPSRISIEGLQNQNLEDEELKTAQALFELADINIEEILHADNFEDFNAELEATEAIITDELFEYWSSNKNLEIVFKIDKKDAPVANGGQKIIEHILDIRVKNSRTKVSLPLKNRSKGFNWFFSFLVWFKKIQEDKDSNYVLLLDEPGLNLHASAQADLLRFIEDLTQEYQIIYTTHSPFMVEPENLHKVRTVVETETGSVISDSVQERDPKTLFPLQAALGYDIAQNLFVSKNNLLIEGVSDLIYLQVMSGILQEAGRSSLDEKISLVPVGGMEKVSTFVSLLRGSQLNIACLLDSSIDSSSKSKLENVIREKLIERKKIVYFDEFVTASEADIEDIFSKEEYLNLFNEAFSEHKDIVEADLNGKIARIVLQINKHLNVDRFNHYRPSNILAQKGVKASDFSEQTLSRFEDIFKKINSLFP